ncbi:ribonuclease H-like domain-containing protein, partial [Tanacetum coccineum]
QRSGRNLDFKEKQPVSLDKSKVECYNCHKKGHFARECRSRRNQGRRSYGDNGRSNAPINESLSYALVAQDGLGGYDWSNDFEVEQVNYALMAISSSSSSSSFDNEVQNYSKQCVESFKSLQKNFDSEREKHNRARLEIQGYEIALESLESRILGHEKNELAWGEKYEFQNYELKCREIKINNLQMELEKDVKERDELKLKTKKWEESSKNLSELLNNQMSDKDKTDQVMKRPHQQMIDEFTIRKKIIKSQTTELNTESSKPKISEVNIEKPKSVVSTPNINREKVIIEDWNSDDEDDVSEVSPVKSACTTRANVSTARPACTARPKVSTAKLVYAARPVSTARPGNLEIFLHDHAVVDSGCSSHMIGNKAYLSDYKDYNGGFVAFGSDPKGEFKNYAMNEFCAKKWNGVAESKNRTLIKAARTMLIDSLLPIPFWAEAVNTACYVLNRVLVTKSQNKTPYEWLLGKPPSISFMRPFGCPLTILNTLDPLSKFDGKSDEGYLLGYSTSSKAFRVYNKRTKRVEENVHIDFLEDQPNMAGIGPDWMFDLDFLTNTMNYIPVRIENHVNMDAGTQESYVAGSSGKVKEPTQDYILHPIHPHRPRIPVEEVVQAAQEKPSENAPKEYDVQDLKDVAEKEEQHKLTEVEQALKDDLEKLVSQEVAAKAMDDATRQAFEEEKRTIASQKRAT